MTTVHLFTDLTRPTLSASDELLAEALHNRGIDVIAQPWETHCEHIHGGVVRSTWNYAHNLEAFKTWLNNGQQLCNQLFNPSELLIWNLDKSYLQELSPAGAQVVPLQLLTEVSAETWVECTKLFGDDLVVKPRVGNSGHGVARVRSATEFIEHAKDDYLVQPFVPELASGEVSFIFFETTFSHAIRRIARAGEFRANIAQGATVVTYEPTTAEIDAVTSIIACLPQTPLYSRIDGYFTNQQFVVSEIELIEPGLFLREGALRKAAERFADCILARI